MKTPPTGRIGGVVSLLVAGVLIAGCATGGAASPGSAVPAGGAEQPLPGASAGDTPVARTLPRGAIAAVDPGSWAIADRLAAGSYTGDTTAALVAGLAQSGIGTFADPASAVPDVAVAGTPGPLRLLDFQVHALAVGAWTGSKFSGAELDAILPVPPDPAGMPTTSDVLAAYVAAADSPGGSLSRALMAGQDLLAPPTLRFPAVVLVLFASDLATDGGAPTPSGASPSAAADRNGIAFADLAVAGPGGAGVGSLGVASGGVCSDTANWINGTISALFDSLRAATPDNLPGRIVVSIWNWLVSQGEALVRGLLSSITDAVLGTVRSIAGTIAAVAEQIASLVPYGLRVTAAGATGGATFMLGPDPLPGAYTVSVSAGDVPDWPAVLADCASVAGVALADFHARGVPLTWGPIDAPADPKLTPTAAARTTDVTDANGQASWPFVTSVDPGDPTGEQQNQVDAMPVAIHRPEIEAARQHLTAALLGFVPGILQPFVAAIFAPYISGLQARLNALLDARGSGRATIVFHAGASPSPSQPASPAPSGACSPSPVIPGKYTGTIANTSNEVIDQGAFGKTVATSTASGAIAMVVAPDGSVGGTWDMTMKFVFDETATSPGSISIHDHRDFTASYTGGSVTGTACNLGLAGGTYRVLTCMDSVNGDCTGEPVPPTTTPAPGGLGSPSSVTPGHVSWRWTYSESEPVVTDLLVLDLAGPTP
jgi:hypothetical protein